MAVMWEAEFVGGELDGTVRTFPGAPPPLLMASVVVQLLPYRPPCDWAADDMPSLVWVRYRLEVCMDPERPAWRLVLDR